ncbi:hypothetical protein [Bradyrhizobium sp. AZCC 1610]|uniref:hypothetical protein n=1 Tax=Bradyrhizobium sp. AZCC 1610 TaxID=3117020 RepID=UPI002FEE6A80
MGSAIGKASIALASLVKQRQDALARSAREIFPDIDVLCTVRHCGLAAARQTPLHAINTNQNLIGLVNRSGVSIHHFGNGARICPVAFILRERAPLMVNRWCAAAGKASIRDVPA